MLDQDTRLNIFPFPFLELTQDIAEHFFVFQDDGEEDRFHGPGMGHVNGGVCVAFGPVEEAVKGFLVFLAQALAKISPKISKISLTEPSVLLPFEL